MIYKLIIIVRSDLSLSEGKLAVQVAHAAVCCAISGKKYNTEWFDNWFSEGQRKVVLKVPDENALKELELEAKKRKLTTTLITDAGLTEIPPGTVTCLGIGPAPEKEIDRVTGNLPLL